MKTKTTENEDVNYGYTDVGYEVETTITKTAKTIGNKLPILPFELWQKIVAFMCKVSDKHNAEAVCSLTVIDSEWVPIIWHQKTEGTLHVKYDESSDENQALLDDETRDALQQVHCTIHSHNKSLASQSSDDQRDEKAKRGWHITVGNCDKDKFSLHTRFNVFSDAVYGTEGEMKGKKIKPAQQEFIQTTIDTVLGDTPSYDGIPKEFLKNMKEIAATKPKVKVPKKWMDRVTEHKSVYSHSPTLWPGDTRSPYQQVGSWYPKKKTTYGDENNITYKSRERFFTQFIKNNCPVWTYCQCLYEHMEGYRQLADIIDGYSQHDTELFDICNDVRVDLVNRKLGQLRIKKKELGKHLPNAMEIADILVDVNMQSCNPNSLGIYETTEDIEIITDLYNHLLELNKV